MKWAERRPASIAVPLALAEELSNSLVRDVSLTLGTRLLGVAAGVVTLTVTTRLLGPEGRGQFAVVMASLALLLQFSNLGLPSSAIYFLSCRPQLRKEVGGLLFWYSLVGVSLLAALAYGWATWDATLIRSVPSSLLGIAFLAAPAAMFVLLAGNALLALGSPTLYNLLDLGIKLTGLISVVILFWWPLEGLFIGYAFLHFPLAAVAYAKLLGRTAPTLPDPRLVRELLGYGLRAFLVTLAMFVVLRIDLFLVNSLRGTAEAGQYSVAVQVGEILNLTAASIAAMLFPRLSAMNHETRWIATWNIARTTALILGIGAVALALLGRFIFVTWFGSAFVPAVVALWWLLPGLWCLGVNTILHQHLAASGMPWFLVGATSFGAALNVLLNLLLVPIFGIAGAAGASSGTYGALLLLTVLYIMKYRWAPVV